jgi:hypothetical protein
MLIGLLLKIGWGKDLFHRQTNRLDERSSIVFEDRCVIEKSETRGGEEKCGSASPLRGARNGQN